MVSFLAHGVQVTNHISKSSVYSICSKTTQGGDSNTCGFCPSIKQVRHLSEGLGNAAPALLVPEVSREQRGQERSWGSSLGPKMLV